jgi:hypothetical protein
LLGEIFSLQQDSNGLKRDKSVGDAVERQKMSERHFLQPRKKPLSAAQ